MYEKVKARLLNFAPFWEFPEDEAGGDNLWTTFKKLTKFVGIMHEKIKLFKNPEIVTSYMEWVFVVHV